VGEQFAFFVDERGVGSDLAQGQVAGGVPGLGDGQLELVAGLGEGVWGCGVDVGGGAGACGVPKVDYLR
jgi:hypothetical protein